MSLSEAISAYDRGEYDRTRDLCLEALSHDLSGEDRILAYTYLGHALVNLGDLRGANEQFSHALALQPSSRWRVHLHYRIGVGLRKLGDSEGPRREFQRAIEQFEEPAIEEVREEFVYSLRELAALEYKSDEYAAALAHAERAAQVSIPARPENKSALRDIEVLRGKALFWLDRWRESIPVLRRALAQVPESDADTRAAVMCFLGLALCAVQEYGEGFEVLKKTELDPAKQPGLWVATRACLGNLYYLRDEYAKALEQFEAIADRPAEEWADSRESLARMADCYLETGRPERGLTVAERAYRELPGNGLVHIAFAKALAVAGRYEEAERVLRELDEGVLEEGLRGRLYAHSAYVALGLRQRDRAEHWLHKLEALNPNSRYLDPLRALMKKGPEKVPGILRWLGRWK